MNPIVKKILAVIAGIFVGSIVNIRSGDDSVPLWFDAIDLIFAYLPMAYMGGRLN